MLDVNQFKDIYIMEAEEHIQKLNDNIIQVEKIYSEPAKQAEVKRLLNELMRSSHTIKGSSASMGYVKLAFLTHVMEDVFDGARNDRLILSPSLIAKAFEAIDLIERSVVAVKTDNPEVDSDAFANNLKVLAGVETEGIGKSIKKSQGNQAGEVVKEVIVTDQGVVESKTPDKSAVEIPSSDEVAEAAKISYIKVPVERLETLMDLIEELLIDKMRLEQLAVKNSVIKEVSDHISLLVSGIQFQIMQARLVPVEQIFGRFPRMVRDLALKENKKIDFQIIGSEIELDRTIVDKLGEPLIHLLRNAVDHGIINEGHISLRAVRESDSALFIVENDSQNIDFEKVRQAAIKRNIVSEEEAKDYNQDQLVDLLFHPRLSTRDVVSEISGRGVGLSVVKSFVEVLNGRVIVENINPGVRFTLELPLTLAIINALLVQVQGSIFAIPFTNVERSVLIAKEDVKYMADREVAIVDGANIPLVRFTNIAAAKLTNVVLGSQVAPTELKPIIGDASVTAVIVRREDERIGIVVDKLINVQEVIVKPLAPILKAVKEFSGSTILGDGRTILILDALNMIQSVKN